MGPETKKLALIIGTRPNFMKAASLLRAAKKEPNIEMIVIHTGQHYDYSMSAVFLNELGIDRIDYSLDIGSSSHSQTIANVMLKLEPILIGTKPSYTIVVGDVNSSLAGALTSAKLNIPIIHVEAGLRSFDHTMPEEINRVLIDRISTLHFITEPAGYNNLINEGHSAENLCIVGNTMIDTLIYQLNNRVENNVHKKYDIAGKYIIVTVHRPSNVDNHQYLQEIVDNVIKISNDIAIIWPIHPRTKNKLEKFKLLTKLENTSNIKLLPPIGYNDFSTLMRAATIVVTDSGGIQEETTFLGIPCLTARDNTERPITLKQGTNVLIGRGAQRLISEVNNVLSNPRVEHQPIDLWDGSAGQRIIEIISAREL